MTYSDPLSTFSRTKRNLRFRFVQAHRGGLHRGERRPLHTLAQLSPAGGREPNVVDCAQCAGQPDVIPGCQTSRDALSESGAEDLIDFASYLEDAKITDVYLPFLRRGIAEVPDEDEHDTDDEGDDE